MERFYRNKNILITGHTGFKGSWLAIWLNKIGANVIGYSLDSHTENDNFQLSNIKDKIIDIRGDIRDKEKLLFTFNKYRPTMVFHLAAQPLVRLSYSFPELTYETNVLGTLNVLQCIRMCLDTKVGVMVTTDKCYENKEQIWPYREDDVLGGYDPYSSSKACAEILIKSYRDSYLNTKDFYDHGKVIASVRAGNIIGGGDWAEDRIVPDCIRAIEKDEFIFLRNPRAIRPWQYVLEPLYGYLLLGMKLYIYGCEYSGAWNFGGDYSYTASVEDLVNLIIKEYGKGQYKIDNNMQLHESQMLTLDCAKAKNYLKWKTRLSLEECVRFTVDWYKQYSSKNVYNLCCEQIEKFIKGG